MDDNADRIFGGTRLDNVECHDNKDEEDIKRRKYPEYCRTMTITDSNGVIKEMVFPKALDLDRPKRARTTFSPEQLYYLEQEFQRIQYLVGKERSNLARRLGLSETQVKVWFQNRRTKYKRDRSREAEMQEAKSESVAACNLLRILHQRPPPVPATSAFISPYRTFSYIGYGAS